MAAEQIREGQRRPLVGHVVDLDAGLLCQHGHGQVRLGAGPCRGEVQPAGIGTAEVDEVRQILEGTGCRYGHEQRHRGDHAHRREVLLLVLRVGKHQRPVDQRPVRAHEQRVAVWLGTKDRFAADHAPCSAPVVDDHGLAQPGGHGLHGNAGREVGIAARGKWNDHPDRPRREIVRGMQRHGRKRTECHAGQYAGQMTEFHECLQAIELDIQNPNACIQNRQSYFIQ